MMTAGISDKLNLVSRLTPRRVWNASQIVSSFQYSRLVKRPVMAGLPISVSIEPTTSCNLRCPECPSGLRSFSRPTGMLDRNMFTRLIDELAPTLAYLTFYFQGEPFLHPGFLDMVSYASRKKIYTSTSTNAHFLKDEVAKETVLSGLDRLIISIDGTTQQTYESYRIGGSLDRVLEGTRNIVEWKRKLASKTPHIIFQFLVVRQNETQVAEVKAMARDIGVDDVVLKTAQIYDFRNGSPLIPTLDRYSRYRKNDDGSYNIKNPLLNECWKMWNSCVITWDGKVVPCCFDKDAAHTLGNFGERTFKEIWYGDAYQQFRKTLLESRDQIEICKNCTEGTKIWA